jgi:hypothetical protein
LPVRAVVRRQMSGPFGWKDLAASRPARCHNVPIACGTMSNRTGSR